MSRISLLRLGFAALLLVLLAALTPTAGAALEPAPVGASSWTGEYYNNLGLSGSPTSVRDDPRIDFFWPAGTSPVPGRVNTEYYSVRWSRNIDFDATGAWNFATVNDDGMRVWVDGAITIDAWYDQPPSPHAGTIQITAGWHLVKVEYYNRTLGGTARVSWSPPSPLANWNGEYFNNRTLSGSPVLTRGDADINFNWGYGSPDPAVPADRFSVRWTRTVSTSAGTYRFTVTTDDGVRLWVDDSLLVDRWVDQSSTTLSADRFLGTGNHIVKMEYYENGGTAVAQLTFMRATAPPAGVWLGQYFDNMYLAGAPVLVRDDPTLDMNWGTGSPGPGIPVDHFSAKWDSVQTIGAPGSYTVRATSDDGVRVWIDGAIAIDAWYDHPPATFTSVRQLTAGAHNVHVEFYEHLVGAMIKFEINLNNPPPPSGDMIVDDRGAGWQAGGCPSCWQESGAGFGGHAFRTLNNSYAASGYNWAQWTPGLPHAGNYQVSVYLPAGIGNTTGARYWTVHAGSYDLAVLNQGLYSNEWVVLGTLYFSGSGDEHVSLTDVTYECFLCRSIVFDAVKFSPR